MRTIGKEIWGYILVLICVLIGFSGSAQTVIFSSDFSPGPSSWQLNARDSVHGKASVSGGENRWITNNSYKGNATALVPNTNLQPVGITGSPRSHYLHINANNLSLPGVAAYNANYLYNNPGRDQYMTRMVAPISTSGLKDVEFSFWWLNYADSFNFPNDTSGQVFYSIDSAKSWIRTPKTYSGDSIWKKETIKLPVFDNQKQLMFAFVFINPDTGFHPAFAIDDVMLTGVPSNTPTANFTQDKILVCQGKCVQFTDLSTGNPSKWSWNFGTGNVADTSNLQNPSFCFPNVGKFSITLTASNSKGSGAPLTKTNLISVVDCNAPPQANFSMNGLMSKTITICSGDSVIFADSSSGAVQNRYWSFPGAADDSGNCRIVNDTIPLVKILYPCAGGEGRDTIYPVTLNVSGAGGATFITKNVRVKSCIGAKSRIKGHTEQRKTCVGSCVTYEYDHTIEDEFYITDKPTFKWYFWGISDTVDSMITKIDTVTTNPLEIDTTWFYRVYSPLGPIAVDTNFEKDTVYTDPSITVCYPDSGSYKLALVTENIYGKDSLMYRNIVSVYGYPQVDALVDKPVLVRGYSNELTTNNKEEHNGRPVPNCKDMEEFDKYINGDSSRCHNYFWSYKNNQGDQISDNIDNWRSQTTRARPDAPTWYYVIRENFNGCRTVDSVQIHIDSTYEVGIPEIFTPGKNGSRNSRWYIFGNRITKIDVKVFNRYGQIVYQTDKVNQIVWESDIAPVGAGWDGNYKNQVGKELDPGVYVYVVKLWHETGEIKDLSGNVTLVR